MQSYFKDPPHTNIKSYIIKLESLHTSAIIQNAMRKYTKGNRTFKQTTKEYFNHNVGTSYIFVFLLALDEDDDATIITSIE